MSKGDNGKDSPSPTDFVSTNDELIVVEEIEDEENELVHINEVNYPAVRELAELLPEDMRKDYKITKKAARKLAMRLGRLKHGGTVEIPMMCVGSSCPMARNCPLLEEDVAPIGQVCPIEKYLTESLRAYYINDLRVDINNFVHMTQVNDLVECEILDQRMTAYLSKDGWFEDVVVGMRDDGTAIFKKDEAISFKIKMRIKGRKDKLLRSFLATREMQAKYNLSQRKDPSSYASELLSAGEKMKVNDEISDAEITQVDDEQ